MKPKPLRPSRPLRENQKPVTHREMLAVIADWSRCLKDSYRPAHVDQMPDHIQRELQVLKALSNLVRADRQIGGHHKPNLPCTK